MFDLPLLQQSFANPVVTVARALTATFSGIEPGCVPGFLAAQAIGATLAACADGAFAGGDEPRAD